MKWLRKAAWLRPILLAVSTRPGDGPEEGSFKYPQPPTLQVPADLKAAVDAEGEANAHDD